MLLLTVLMVIAGLGVASTSAWGSVASGHVSGDGNTVHIRRADERFAAQAGAVTSPVAPQYAQPDPYAPAQQSHPHSGGPVPLHQPPYGQQ